MAALASMPSTVAASTFRNGGGAIKANRQRAAFNGSDTERLSRMAAATAQGAFAARWTFQGFSRHRTTPRKQSGR